jgi:hypothetical protein
MRTSLDNFAVQVIHRREILAVAALLCLFLSGCGRSRDVSSAYAKERMTGSINGLEVFTDLLEKRGNSIKHYSRLSPSLRQQDVLFWFPDDFTQPNDQALWFIEDWLSRAPNRMVFFVGRDYDAGAEYWSKVISQSPADEREIAARRLADARQRVDLARLTAGDNYKTPWFTFENATRETTISAAQGDWAKGIDFSKSNLRYQSKLLGPPAKVAEDTLYDEEKVTEPESIFGEMEEEEDDQNSTGAPPTQATPPPSKPVSPMIDNPFRVGRKLIDGGAAPFAFELVSNRFPGSRVFIIQNARFLVNYGLVNKEHRKLCQNMLQEIPSTAKIAILHSEPGGPPIYWGTITAEKVKPEEVINTTLVLLQLTLPVLLLLFALLPIFGRPRDLPRTEISDFGKHIDAIGGLLQRGGDERYAWSRVFAYQQLFRRESGKRHASAASTNTQAARYIILQISAAAFGPGRATELGTGQWIETTITSRNIGKVTGKSSQPAYLEMQVAVQDPEFARTAIDAILREGRLQDQTTLFIR